MQKVALHSSCLKHWEEVHEHEYKREEDRKVEKDWEEKLELFLGEEGFSRIYLSLEFDNNIEWAEQDDEYCEAAKESDYRTLKLLYLPQSPIKLT